MNRLIKGAPILIPPSLTVAVGLNAAISLQQLHVNLLISTHVRDGHKWVYKTYEEWKNEEFPFWSVNTIKRAIQKLEDNRYIISTNTYNDMPMTKIKSYRIHYPKLPFQTMQHVPSTMAKSPQEEVQIALSTEGKMPLAIT